MERVKFAIADGLSDKFTKLILDDVHQLVGEVGLEIQHPGLLKELAGHDGVTVKGERVCYSAELVEKARAEVPKEDANYAAHKAGDERFRLCTPFSPFDVLDFESGEKRPAEERDLIEGAKLYDAFDATGPVHVYVRSYPEKTAQVTMAKLCCAH